MKRKRSARRGLPVKLLLLAAALIAVALTLAACGGSGNGESSTTMGGGAEGSGGAAVSAKSIGDAGPVLVDSSGQALYTSDLETDGKVMCTGACTSFWQPLTASEGAPSADPSLPGKVAVIMRPDGTRQVSYVGHPLYSFTQEGPAEVTGDGFVDDFDGHKFTWSVVQVEGGGGETSGSGGAAESSGSRSYGY
jgi:predicted lipoprotein with Yx(FWY)xxD motif